MNVVLVANRGEIAVRVIRACQACGLGTVLAASTVDARTSLAAQLADRVVTIGGPRPADSYLRLDAILAAAKGVHADAVHPGYGFLSEKWELAAACSDEGITFIGPDAQTIEVLGDKVRARETAASAGVPVLPGARIGDRALSPRVKHVLSEEIGYPLLVKAVHGGGGRGIRRVDRAEALDAALSQAVAESEAAFGSRELYVERLIAKPRHIEVQILGLPSGEVVAIGDRDCTVQRRHQKLIEEAPAPTVPAGVREGMLRAAERIGSALRYQNAGTVEFIFDPVSGDYYFLEVNARLQVEHPVTEATTGLDLVRCQLEIAAKQFSATLSALHPRGAAIECRVNAEDPAHTFRPNPGVIQTWKFPPFGYMRLDSHCYDGYEVSPYYDSLLGKIIVYGANREEARMRLVAALQGCQVVGIKTTVPWLLSAVQSDDFRDHNTWTTWVDEVKQ